jgi:hypothetical protein
MAHRRHNGENKEWGLMKACKYLGVQGRYSTTTTTTTTNQCLQTESKQEQIQGQVPTTEDLSNK